MKTNKDSELLKQKIKTALEATSPRGGDAGYVEWFSTALEGLSHSLRIMLSDTDASGQAFSQAFKSDLVKETSEYGRERLKWMRYRQSRSKSIDDTVKSKDEMARLIKQHNIDVDHLVNSAADGDVQSLITVYPFFNFIFQRYEPYWWERFIIFLLRRKIDTNPS